MTPNIKKLEDLYTDSSLLDELEISSAIHPIVAIQRESKKVFIKDNKFTNTQKILAFALAKKLLFSKGEIESEKIASSEILKEFGLKRGTVDGEFGKLRKKGILVCDKKADGYEIPVYKIDDALGIINSK